ncbi:MAG: glycosyltransferase family 4 protein [Acidobacteriia bacterium]|nr:glycosyltransferase family 4 protein [Terriglobia bacterium]
MKKNLLLLEQQSWRSGAQRVLEAVIDSLGDDFEPIVAFPGNGPFRSGLERNRVETTSYPLGTYSSGSKSFSEKLTFGFRSVACGLKMAALIRRRGIRLIYINGPRAILAGVLASQISGCPAVFHLHLTLTRRSDITLVTRLAPFLAKIIVCSHATARPILDADPRVADKIHVLYNPVPSLRCEAAAPSDAPVESPHITLGMVGRITEAKGQGKLLAAVGALRPEQRENIHLIFLGSPAPGNDKDIAYAEHLRVFAQELNLQDKVYWAGYQSRPGPYFSQMDALVIASSSRAGEAMPIVVLEALQKGVPVIASRTGGIPEVIQHGWNGLLVSPQDGTELTRAIERFLVDKALRGTLRSRARAGLDGRFSMAHFKLAVRRLVNELSPLPETEPVQATVGELAAWK